MLRLACSLTPATWDVATTFSMFSRGLSADTGSSSQTSSPAALSFPRVSASNSARSSWTLPRDVLMKIAPSFIWAIVLSLIMCWVSSVSGVWHVTMSAWPRSVDRPDIGSASRRLSSSGGT